MRNWNNRSTPAHTPDHNKLANLQVTAWLMVHTPEDSIWTHQKCETKMQPQYCQARNSAQECLMVHLPEDSMHAWTRHTICTNNWLYKYVELVRGGGWYQWGLPRPVFYIHTFIGNWSNTKESFDFSHPLTWTNREMLHYISPHVFYKQKNMDRGSAAKIYS